MNMLRAFLKQCCQFIAGNREPRHLPTDFLAEGLKPVDSLYRKHGHITVEVPRIETAAGPGHQLANPFP